MSTKQRTVLIPWDFSEKSEFAYAHAVNISKITGTTITLINVVKSDKEISDIHERLKLEAERMKATFSVLPETVVIVGSIFKSISKYSNQGGIEMVVMGTHGIVGMQKFIGSRALKVIRGSRVPFFVVQDMPHGERIDNIVFPIDFKHENKEKIKWAHYLCNLYKSKIHIVHPIVSDSLFKRRILSNIVFAKKYFDNTDINWEIKAIGTKIDFAKDVINYSERVKANLILIMTSKTLTFADYVMGPSEQYIIANSAKIPVMVVNPRPKELSGGFSASGN